MVRCQRDFVTLTSPRPAFIPSHGIRSGLFASAGAAPSPILTMKKPRPGATGASWL